jgi:serine/threonine protein kinase
MGEVYQAKDQKLRRDVAIKVLPEEFAKDTDRVARFRREAMLLASLNHPNIASIYGLKESDGTHFLVLELIEGDTLADRIKRGPVTVEESLKLALQAAEALEAAHEKGVIHRDLKPANIKVTSKGKRVVFYSLRGDGGLGGTYWKSEDGIGEDELLGSKPDRVIVLWSFSRDGKALALIEQSLDPLTLDIGMMSMEGNREIRELLHDKQWELEPQI